MPRIAVVRKERCNPVACGGYLCMRVCPVNRQGTGCIQKDETDGKVKIDESTCIGCMICVHKCPFEAIDIVNLPEDLCKQPVHQYGRNGFHLYNIPMPLFGQVVGVIGKNGIGKSTALKILAGLLHPNLGTDHDANKKELLSFYKGTASQTFFEQLTKGEITAAYKPQQVDMIPKTTTGTVRQLLEKLNPDKKLLDKALTDLSITAILDSDISKISGGELQRVAIAATTLRNASLMLIDEPTSYLDIKQRMKTASFIKDVTTETTSTIVIEHDLIVLDYLADVIHALFGNSGSYGIVSQPKNARVGMNAYLEGFLKEENMRIRDKAIAFPVKPPFSAKKGAALTEWTDISQKLGTFVIEAPQGSITRGHVIGVVGENGTGKTSFVKLLAGISKADSGTLSQGVRVSYKPQYLETSSEETVATVLRDAIARYDVALMRPLDLKHLLTRKLSELSGGELQRVAIAKTLSADADLYLLDEPSAYLDVEQRLAVAKMLKEFMESTGKTALVVDHDLLFIDYISTQLLVFEGTPAVHGVAHGPFSVAEGMERFLTSLGLTFRRDPQTNRPRANKLGSKLDTEQKKAGKRYYS